MGKFDDFIAMPLSKQGKRLLREWMEIDKLCYLNKRISYLVRRRNGENLPVEYEIIYRIKSFTIQNDRTIIGIKNTRNHPQQSCFSGTVRTEQTKNAALLNAEANVVHRFLGGIMFLQVVQF